MLHWDQKFIFKYILWLVFVLFVCSVHYSVFRTETEEKRKYEIFFIVKRKWVLHHQLHINRTIVAQHKEDWMELEQQQRENGSSRATISRTKRYTRPFDDTTSMTCCLGGYAESCWIGKKDQKLLHYITIFSQTFFISTYFPEKDNLPTKANTEPDEWNY